MRGWASLAVAVAMLWAPAGLAPVAAAAPLPPEKLHVVGGDEAWHPDRAFFLNWTNPTSGSPAAGVHYRILGPMGTIGEEELPWPAQSLRVDVPWLGTFTAEVWLENTAGEEGPAAKATLRYDNVRPAGIGPPKLPHWIGHNELPLTIHLGALLGPAPISGIHGYAVKVAPTPGAMPCVAADRCTDAETTLRQGPDGNALSLIALTEGTSYLSAVAVSGSGMKSATAAEAVFHVDLTDPVTRLAGAPAGWVSHPVQLTATATDDGSGMGSGGPGSFTAIRVDDGAPVIGTGSSVATTVIAEGAHTVAYYARDAAGNVDDGGADNGVANRPPRTATVKIDRGAPSVAFANSQDPRDPDLLRARIVDPLSGPDPLRGRIGVRPAGSGDRFEPLPPASPADGELRARWDSDAYPTGEYEFQAIGYDAAGNSTTTTRRSNGAPMVLSNPLKATTALRAGFAGPGLQRIVRYGRGVRLGGRLTTGRSTPMPGMPVRIVERFAPGAAPAVKVSTVRTGPGGAFSIRLEPGPSREVAATFDGSPTLARSAGGPLRLGVRSCVRLRASSTVARVGGAPLVFRGLVAAPPGAIPAEGKSVQLQFRLPGSPWTEFRTIQTNARGRFRYAYRFSDDDSRGARFQFRAYAPPQDDWPYEPGGSRPVLVEGR